MKTTAHTTKELTFSQCKMIYNFAEEISEDPKEIIEKIVNEETDFNIGDYRFIHTDFIDSIQVEELESDPYVLGCFNDWFIADITEIDVDVIQAMQKAEAFEAIGKLIISLGKLEELQAAYASSDGYGHHFNNYDGNEEELRVDGQMFHVFDNRN